MLNRAYFPHKYFTDFPYTAVVHNGWKPLFDKESSKLYFITLQEFLHHEHKQHTIFPPQHRVYAAFEATPLANTRVVILGQDPYHGPGQANGLAFSVQRDTPLPPSLRNIFRELVTDLDIDAPRHGDLTPWAQQGVLLLNTTLTVREGEPLSHAGEGWEQFTDAVIEHISATQKSCVFVLWGASAQKKSHLIDTARHHVVRAAHPSPLSAHRGFFGSRPFSTINRLLVESGQAPIDWALPDTF